MRRNCAMQEKFDSIESLRILYRITTMIQSDLKLSEKFKSVIDLIAQTSECESASLFIYNESSGKLDEVASVGARVDLIESINFDMGKGFSAWVAKQRRPVLIPNLRRDREGGFRSFLSTPLISNDHLIGVLNLGRKDKDAFTERHMEILEIIAGQLAHAIERSDFERRLLEKNDDLNQAHKEIEEQHKKIIEMEKYQAIGQMTASLNHEINNPLTTILGNIELLLMMKPDMDEDIRKKLVIMQAEAKRISQLIDKLRDIKRVVTEKYINRYEDRMIDIKSSLDDEDEDAAENLS